MNQNKLLFSVSRKKKHNSIQSFTLIEILTVLGIIALLMIMVLVAINPAEVQRKTRDQKRMKDLQTLQATIEQYLGTFTTPPSICGNASTVTCLSSIVSASNSQPCQPGGSNWLGFDACPYVSSVPSDPRNNTTITYQNADPAATTNSSTGNTPTISGIAQYRLKLSGFDYEINIQQESASNKLNLTADGGNSYRWVEVGPSLILLTD